MKHLKSIFESFRSLQIKEDIKDIFEAEVDNSNFVMTDASLRVETGSFAFKVQKEEDKSFGVVETFQVMELADFIERLLNYSDLSPCEIQVYVPLPLGSEYITKGDLREAKSKLGFFSDYLTHTIMIKVTPFK